MTAVGYSLYRLRTDTANPNRSLVGSVAAAIFAAQMVNFPLGHLGVSGHLLGGVLAAVLLGPWAGCLAVAAVLCVQSVVFGDGGWQALGANIFNMAVIGCWGGTLLWTRGRQLWGSSKTAQLGSAAVAAWGTVFAAAVAFGLEFLLSGHGTMANLQQLWTPLLGYHALIGLGEAAITMGLLGVIWSWNAAGQREQLASDRLGQPTGLILGAMLATCAMAVMLAPWASPWPDGLDAAGEMLAFTELERDSLSLFADYALPLPTGWEALSISLAGLLGTLLVAGLATSLQSLPRLVSVKAHRRHGR